MTGFAKGMSLASARGVDKRVEGAVEVMILVG
jgi:hypothetical protein